MQHYLLLLNNLFSILTSEQEYQSIELFRILDIELYHSKIEISNMFDHY